jgi:hypothetical protein
LPEIDDEKPCLFAVGQPVEKLACLLVARSASYHLPEFNARVDWLHKHQVHHLRDIDAGVEHIDRDCEPGLVLLFKLADETVAVSRITCVNRGEKELVAA